MPSTLNALLKRKPVMILAVVAVVCFSGYCILDFASMARNNRTQVLLHEINAIMTDVEKLPPGIELVRRLKALDPGSAPPECKHALRDYTAALEGSVAAMKAGRNSVQYDAPMANAKQRLADCFRQYR
jgi:hypothetical protein